LQPISNAFTLNMLAVITPLNFFLISIDFFASFVDFPQPRAFFGMARIDVPEIPSDSPIIRNRLFIFIKPGRATFLLFFRVPAPTMTHSLF